MEGNEFQMTITPLLTKWGTNRRQGKMRFKRYLTANISNTPVHPTHNPRFQRAAKDKPLYPTTQYILFLLSVFISSILVMVVFTVGFFYIYIVATHVQFGVGAFPFLGVSLCVGSVRNLF